MLEKLPKILMFSPPNSYVKYLPVYRILVSNLVACRLQPVLGMIITLLLVLPVDCVHLSSITISWDWIEFGVV